MNMTRTKRRLLAFLSGVMADAITEILAPVKGIEVLLRRRRERVAYRKSYEAWRIIMTRQLRLPPLAVIQEGSGAGGHPDHVHPDHVRRHPDHYGVIQIV